MKFEADHLTILALVLLNCLYVYILTSQTDHDFRHKNFVIKEDTKANFQLFMNSLKGGGGDSGYGKTGTYHYSDKWEDDYRDPLDNLRPNRSSHPLREWDDDFYISSSKNKRTGGSLKREATVPSEERICKAGYLQIRSNFNYKYLWMSPLESGDVIVDASATIDTPDHLRSFTVVPVRDDCSHGGWVLLRAPNSQSFVYMRGPNVTENSWVVTSGTSNVSEAASSTAYWFLLEKGGYLLNKGSLAFVNNIASGMSFAVRGHTEEGDRTEPAYREYGASMSFQFIDEDRIAESIEEEKRDAKESEEQDAALITTIQGFPASSERRVISFGLYGSNKKYTGGAVANARLRDVYFPGWTCRFYVTADVPAEVVDELTALGAEVKEIPGGEGYVAGMFYRFSVAGDPSVDRFIVRDTDSRLNARDRLAVEEWAQSGAAVHVLRDHVNHCGFPMNGGMWGGVRGALPSILADLRAWTSKDLYAADLQFLAEKVWPIAKHSLVAHDSYCCDRFEHTLPFPSKRPHNYQHVGQVFDAYGHPRMSDIDGYIRGVPIPSKCRKQADWIYG